MQEMNYGELRDLEVRDSEPTFNGITRVVFDIKLDRENVPRPELALEDFVLTEEVLHLMAALDEHKNSTIQHLEVRAGIPRRLVLEARLAEQPTAVGSQLRVPA
jgi:hypothetical protein